MSKPKDDRPLEPPAQLPAEHGLRMRVLVRALDAVAPLPWVVHAVPYEPGWVIEDSCGHEVRGLDDVEGVQEFVDSLNAAALHNILTEFVDVLTPPGHITPRP